MPRHRFFLPSLKDQERKVLINDKKEIHHIADVLRLKAGDTVSVFNGKGLSGEGCIRDISKNAIAVEIFSFSAAQQQKPLIVAACAIPKRSKFETIIEKCTELGVDEIIPLQTSRTEIKASAIGNARQNTRYQEVAINACKQSSRSFLPKIHPATKFTDALDQVSAHDLALIGHIQEKIKKLSDFDKEALQKKDRIIIFIGPEGDFREDEINVAIQKRCLPVTLGPNILKVETAIFAAVSYLMLTLRS